VREPYKLLDLFSGIGGFSLGLERTGGFKTVAFCEIDPFCRKVLRKHWPEVPQYDDVRTLTAERLAADGIAVDAICGGFPCQDISTAGAGAGIEGKRSGLWKEYARIVGEVRPRVVVVENVSALLARGMGRVLGDLAALGYDAEWHCIPASALGAPHRRDRTWIVAHPADAIRRAQQSGMGGGEGAGRPQKADGAIQERVRVACDDGFATSRSSLANATSGRQSGPRQFVESGSSAPCLDRQAIDALAGRLGRVWRAEPDVGRVAHGVPARVDRLTTLGNAVVPQIPELIGRAILAAENR
jgi:DNA (cytosine-5)-methyltransferase 1